MLALIHWIPALAPSSSTPLVSMEIMMTVLGGLTALAFIPFCAQYSELVEDISPALQATGWSFFQLVYRGWIAISGPILLAVAADYGWLTWMWATVIGAGLFVIASLLVRGGWVPARAGHGTGPQTATTPRPSPA
jgi:hypothetical protein